MLNKLKLKAHKLTKTLYTEIKRQILKNNFVFVKYIGDKKFLIKNIKDGYDTKKDKGYIKFNVPDKGVILENLQEMIKKQKLKDKLKKQKNKKSNKNKK